MINVILDNLFEIKDDERTKYIKMLLASFITRKAPRNLTNPQILFKILINILLLSFVTFLDTKYRRYSSLMLKYVCSSTVLCMLCVLLVVGLLVKKIKI